MDYYLSLVIRSAVQRNNNRGIGRFLGPTGNQMPQWVRNYYYRGTCPNGVGWVRQFDFTGCLKKPVHDEFDPELWRDSGCAEETFSALWKDHEDQDSLPRNMITSYFRN